MTHRWDRWCGYMAGIAKKGRTEDIDWLALAINRLGGPVAAAERLGVSKQTIYTWLESGIEKAGFGKIAKLSEQSRITVDMLKMRLGPFPGAPDVPIEESVRADGVE